MTSGVPVNLSYSPAATFSVSGSPTYRPNLTGDPLTPSDQRTINNYLNPATVEIPTDRTQPFGNAPRNVARGPIVLPVRSRPAQGVRARPRQTAARGAHRGVQPAQQDELLDPERQPVERQLRHDHLDVPGAADSAGSEVAFLTSRQLPTLQRSQRFQGEHSSEWGERRANKLVAAPPTPLLDRFFGFGIVGRW